MLSKVSEPAFNQQLALPKCRQKHGKQMAMRPPPSPYGDQPYQLQAWEKKNFDTLFCMSVTPRNPWSDHRIRGLWSDLTGSFCIQVVYLDGWVVYPASTIRSSNVELKLIHRF